MYKQISVFKMKSFSLKHLHYFYIEFKEPIIFTMTAVPRADYLNYNTHLTIMWSLDTCWNNRRVYLMKTKATLQSDWKTIMEEDGCATAPRLKQFWSPWLMQFWSINIILNVLHILPVVYLKRPRQPHQCLLFFTVKLGWHKTSFHIVLPSKT